MNRLALTVGVLAFVCAVPASADVLIAPVEGTNLGASEVDAISETVVAAYRVAQREAVIPLPRARQAIERGGGVQEAARQLGATEYVYATAVRLDERIVLSATRYSVNGAPVHSVKMTAMGLDDVEPASERLAKALADRRAPTSTQTLDNVTRSEGKTPNRVWSEKVRGFKAGFVYPIGWGHELAPMMSAGFSLRVEGAEHFVEFGVGVMLPTTIDSNDDRLAYGGLYGDIGVSFYLAHQSTSPYVGFGVMPRAMSRSVTNLAPYGQFGLMFFRESSTRLYLDARLAQNVLPVGFGSSDHFDSATGTIVDTQQRLYPTELTLHAGVGW